MKFVWVFTIPLGLIVLLIGGAPSMLNVEPKPKPESVILNSESSYSWKAREYARLDMRKEALETCAAIEHEFENGDVDFCLRDVYEILGDIDGQIEIKERTLKEKRAAGDNTELVESNLNYLKEKRDRKR
ncbi:MAG: hypothetical protein DCF25_10210 [Leptolyngbya foveolarum]|uniref:Uncharacterized protein n=1 Tax=Leptolyngbya foveolarum TaxID=47253 RepID=A0A2W4UDA6_9CYAN|nr:MAG: hypothetical protein DCF25_10210 [Leptolyngbya foveolarum]